MERIGRVTWLSRSEVRIPSAPPSSSPVVREFPRSGFDARDPGPAGAQRSRSGFRAVRGVAHRGGAAPWGHGHEQRHHADAPAALDRGAGARLDPGAAPRTHPLTRSRATLTSIRQLGALATHSRELIRDYLIDIQTTPPRRPPKPATTGSAPCYRWMDEEGELDLGVFPMLRIKRPRPPGRRWG
jgi:hypothetical protein